MYVGRGAFQWGRSSFVRMGGPAGKEYAGISSDKKCEKHFHRKSKVS